MNRRRFLTAALAAAGGSAAGPAGGAAGRLLETMTTRRPGDGSSAPGNSPSRHAQAPAGITGVDYFPVYYPWYSGPQKWLVNGDYLPALGGYASRQRDVIAQHMGWLGSNGGAGFTLNWHGPAGFTHQTVEQYFIPELANFPGQEFCIHYDPYIRWGLPMPDFSRDAAAAATWRADARHMARAFMPHPQYARVDGRPIVFVYVARAIEGPANIEAFVDIIRDEAAAAGHPGVYLVLGEAWWIPVNETPENLEIIRSTRAPRTRLCDAVYSYNLATEPVHDRVWRGNVRSFMGEAGRVYKDYRNLMDARGAADRRVITTLMPRFDNTVLRVFEGGPPGMNMGPWPGYAGIDYQQDLTVIFHRLATSFEPVRGTRTLMVVTSWNEWPERSALEPSAPGIDKDGLPTPGDAYLTALGRAVAGFGQPRDPVLRVGGRMPTGASPAHRDEWGEPPPGDDSARPPYRIAEPEPVDPLEAIATALDLSGLTAERTEHVTERDITGGRVRFRRQQLSSGS
jgi:hypothetical protein